MCLSINDYWFNDILISTNLFKDKLIEAFKLIKSYNLVITGTIGVGKSTICQILAKLFKYYSPESKIKLYPEYINYGKKTEKETVGYKLFEMKKKDKINSFTLQTYIMDIWNDLFKENEYTNYDSFNIFERLPCDAVYCFAQYEYTIGAINEDEFKILEQKNKRMIEKYKLFSYDDTCISIIENVQMTDTVKEIIKIIIDDIENGIMNRTICLHINNINTYLDRIDTRGRKGETADLDDCVNFYYQYYKQTFMSD